MTIAINPIATLLTKVSVDLLNYDNVKRNEISYFQGAVFDEVDKQVVEYGIESNELGDRADAYLYCMETKCPECGYIVPMSASWVLGVGSKSIVELVENVDTRSYGFAISMGVPPEKMKKARETATVVNGNLVCPHCGKSTPISTIRRDTIDENGNPVYGLRNWERSEFVERPSDTFKEILYAVRYVKDDGTRYYRAPSQTEIDNENKVLQIVSENFEEWQEKGYIPSSEIEDGYNTSQVVRERDWRYWHQLFNPRQLLLHALLQKAAE